MNDKKSNKNIKIHAIAIFDVCDTLYAQNTTFGFVRYLMRKSKFFLFIDIILTSRISPILLFFVILRKITGQDHIRNLYLWCLKGKSKSELNYLSEAYITNVLIPLVVPWSHGALSEARRENQTVYLLSASIDCVVNAIARRLGVLCHSSQLEYVGDVCTGKLIHDITGQKHEFVLKMLESIDEKVKIRVFTDNLSDIGLVRLADEATVIIPYGRRQDEWPGCNVEFVNA